MGFCSFLALFYVFETFYPGQVCYITISAECRQEIKGSTWKAWIIGTVNFLCLHKSTSWVFQQKKTLILLLIFLKIVCN